MYIFDPESEVISEMDCGPGDWSEYLKLLAANETDLYMWKSEFIDPEKQDYHLYKLNKETLEWKRIMTVRRHGVWISVVIINQIMYVLEDSHNGNVCLITIDLQSSKVLEIKSLPLLNLILGKFLTTHNNALYMVCVYNGIRKVIDVNNGELIEIAQEELPMDSDYQKDMNSIHCDDSAGYSYTHQFQTFEIHTFDFESLKWESEALHPDWLTDFTIRVKSVAKLNELIYTLVWKSEEKRLELHVLDLQPKLTAICLADLTNRLSEEPDDQKIEKVKEQLSIQMRANLEELLKRKNEAK